MLINLFGCSTNISDYKNTVPKLNLQDFLQGKIIGTGIIQDFKGKVTRQFEFSGVASWKGNEGIFNENMTYNNGEKDNRIWKIKKI